jgi:L-lactate dehydrogenase (cytochrome)
MDGIAHPAWLWDVQINGRPHTLGTVASAAKELKRLVEFMTWIGRNFDQAVSWDDIAWVREHWKGPIVLKGVLDVADARIAADLGVDGIVVSNHGGRQLDGAPSSIHALPPIAQAVGDKVSVLMDGGAPARRAEGDTCGALGCLIGRAWAPVARSSRRGRRRHMLQILRQELRVAMALTGCVDVTSASAELLAD